MNANNSKMRKNKVTALFVFILLILPSIKMWASDNFSIFLVRHAEKQKKSDNPSLTVCGQARASQLANLLSQANISTIYSTSYQRTMQTAQPLATLNNLAIKNYSPKSLEQLSIQLKQNKNNALIVGHSNTTPALTMLLSQQDVAALSEDNYQMLYQVQFINETSVVTLFKQPLECVKPPVG